MKYLLIASLFVSFIFANEIEDKNKETNIMKVQSLNKKQLSEKELAYQEYKAKLEEENRKLEEDGFCSCNND